MHIRDILRVPELLGLVLRYYEPDLQAPRILTLWVQLYRDNETLVFTLWQDLRSVDTWLDIQIDREIREIEDQDRRRALRRDIRDAQAFQNNQGDDWFDWGLGQLSPRSDSSAAWGPSTTALLW